MKIDLTEKERRYIFDTILSLLDSTDTSGEGVTKRNFHKASKEYNQSEEFDLEIGLLKKLKKGAGA